MSRDSFDTTRDFFRGSCSGRSHDCRRSSHANPCLGDRDGLGHKSGDARRVRRYGPLRCWTNHDPSRDSVRRDCGNWLDCSCGSGSAGRYGPAPCSIRGDAVLRPHNADDSRPGSSRRDKGRSSNASCNRSRTRRKDHIPSADSPCSRKRTSRNSNSRIRIRLHSRKNWMLPNNRDRKHRRKSPERKSP